MSRLPKLGELKANRLHSIAVLGAHIPHTKGDLKVANELRVIGLVTTDSRGRYVLTDAGTAHVAELRMQRLKALKARGIEA